MKKQPNLENNDLEDKKHNIIIQQQKHIKVIKIAEFVCSAVLLLVIFTSLFFIVAVQIDSKNESYQTAAEICNTYTGIILGFVAMTVSLIGMVLSFHNTKQSEQSNLSTALEFAELKHQILNISEIEKSLSTTLQELERKTIDMEAFKNIENRLDRLTNEMRNIFDETKGNGTEKVSSPKSYKKEEQMDTDEGHAPEGICRE